MSPSPTPSAQDPVTESSDLSSTPAAAPAPVLAPDSTAASAAAAKGKSRAVTIEDVDSDDPDDARSEVTVEDDADAEADGESGRPSATKRAKVVHDPVEEAIARATGQALPGAAAQQHDWQAVWSPPQNAYYFYNTKTFETTWTNPLAPPAASSSSTSSVPTTSTPRAAAAHLTREDSPPWDPSASTLPYTAPAAAASSSSSGLPEIDPSLAYLLPGGAAAAAAAAAGTGYTAQARFNTRTGRYESASDPTRAPDHVSDFSRMKRQNEAFFDQEAWEQERLEREEREREKGGKKKRLTKEDVRRFKENKELKQKRKNAWLRS